MYPPSIQDRRQSSPHKKGVKRKYPKHKSDPYKIINVHTNGTVTIAQDVKHQIISIRNIEPYFRNKI